MVKVRWESLAVQTTSRPLDVHTVSVGLSAYKVTITMAGAEFVHTDFWFFHGSYGMVLNKLLHFSDGSTHPHVVL
jgi:hypothetical protein